jgi:eukaryotic-like serine/threonine-protein kinase
VVLLAILALLLVPLAFDRRTAPDGTNANTPTHATSAAPENTAPGPTPSSTPSPLAGFQLPAGWVMRDDGTGFKVPVPESWKFGRDEDGRALWRDPSTSVFLLIDQTRQPKPDPVQDWLNNERARRAGYRDYQRIRIEAVPYWDSAADWEFTYTSRGNNRLHVLNRGFITAPDQAYSIYWSTPASQWDSWRDELQIVFDGFVPARS